MKFTDRLALWWAAIAARLPFGGLPAIAALLVLIFLVAFFAPFSCAHGAELELQVGGTFVRGPASAAAMKVIFPKVIGGYADLGCGFMLIDGSKFKERVQDPQAIAYCQAFNHIGPVSLGFGIAHLQHVDDYNGGPIDFALSAEWNFWKNFWAEYNHFSCGGTCTPNYGRDILSLAVRW